MISTFVCLLVRNGTLRLFLARVHFSVNVHISIRIRRRETWRTFAARRVTHIQAIFDLNKTTSEGLCERGLYTKKKPRRYVGRGETTRSLRSRVKPGGPVRAGKIPADGNGIMRALRTCFPHTRAAVRKSSLGGSGFFRGGNAPVVVVPFLTRPDGDADVGVGTRTRLSFGAPRDS